MRGVRGRHYSLDLWGLNFSGDEKIYLWADRWLRFGEGDLIRWLVSVGQVKGLLVGQLKGLLIVHYPRRVLAKLFRLIIVFISPPGERSQV